jgi:hypothetical protein
MQSNAAGVVTEKEKETKMYRNSFLFSRGLQPQEKKKKHHRPIQLHGRMKYVLNRGKETC